MGIRLWFAACGLATLVFAGCPTVDLGDTPSDIGQCNPPGGEDYFETMIWPNYLNANSPACTSAGGCHNEAGGNALNLRTQPIDFQLNRGWSSISTAGSSQWHSVIGRVPN